MKNEKAILISKEEKDLGTLRVNEGTDVIITDINNKSYTVKISAIAKLEPGRVTLSSGAYFDIESNPGIVICFAKIFGITDKLVIE